MEDIAENQIYSSVRHMDLEPDQWEQQTAQLRRILETEPNHAFIQAKDLAKRAGFPTNGTQIQMRQAITKLIELQECPIVSNHHGYAWADTPNQIELCINQLQERVSGLQRRMQCLQKIRNKMDGQRLIF